MPTDIFSWIMSVYWPLCFTGAVVLTLVFIKKPVTRELMAAGFGVLLVVVILQRLFWVFAIPTGGGEPRVTSTLLAASTTIFGLGDIVGYLLVFLGLVLGGRKSSPPTT